MLRSCFTQCSEHVWHSTFPHHSTISVAKRLTVDPMETLNALTAGKYIIPVKNYVVKVGVDCAWGERPSPRDRCKWSCFSWYVNQIPLHQRHAQHGRRAQTLTITSRLNPRYDVPLQLLRLPGAPFLPSAQLQWYI